MNGLHTNVDLYIKPCGSYDLIFGMDQMDVHHVMLDFHKNTLTCLDEEGNNKIVKGNLRPISIR